MIAVAAESLYILKTSNKSAVFILKSPQSKILQSLFIRPKPVDPPLGDGRRCRYTPDKWQR